MNKEQSNDLESAWSGLKLLDGSRIAWQKNQAWQNHHVKLEIVISDLFDIENTHSLYSKDDTRNKIQIRHDIGKEEFYGFLFI